MKFNSTLGLRNFVVTGSIGTGKSCVSNIFQHEHGYEVIDCDQIAHDVLDLNVEEIAKEFGEDVIARTRFSDHVIRRKLGVIVFSDDEKRKTLESIVLPDIMKEMDRKITSAYRRRAKFIIDMPTFFEHRDDYGYIEKDFDIISVLCSTEIQKERCMNRDGLTSDQTQNRIDSQICMEHKASESDFVIMNNGTLDYLELRVSEIIKG